MRRPDPFRIVLLVTLSLALLSVSAWASHRSMTPQERIEQAEQKVKDNPLLRNRWDRNSRLPASEASFQTDNLAQQILSQFRKDEKLAEIPVRLKVSSNKGIVTLSGLARSQADIELIGGAVSKMEGVREVRNELRAAKKAEELLEE